MKIRYSARARAQMNAIHEYIRERNETAATAVISRIRHTATVLTEWPHLGRKTDEVHVRMIPVPQLPFVIFYRADGDMIIILNVRHGAQDS